MDFKSNQQIEELVPRRRAADEWNVSPRTVARWERAKLPGFDAPITVNCRIYHKRSRLEIAKAGRDAIAGACEPT
jgi:hypothetical protein